MKRVRASAVIHLCSFTEGLDELPQYKQRNLHLVLAHLHQQPRKRFSVFEATANMHIARTMTTLVQDGYIKTDNSCGYPWTAYELTDKGLAAIGEKK